MVSRGHAFRAPTDRLLHVVRSQVAAGPRFAVPGHTHSGGAYGLESNAQMMSVLTVEARTIVLAGMPPAQRWRIMEEMRDEERAEVVVAMGLDLRKDAAAALSPRVWERTLDAIKNSGNNAARWDSTGSVASFMLSCALLLVLGQDCPRVENLPPYIQCLPDTFALT